MFILNINRGTPSLQYNRKYNRSTFSCLICKYLALYKYTQKTHRGDKFACFLGLIRLIQNSGRRAASISSERFSIGLAYLFH